jgi:predicted RND superfamily exporter protein
MPFEIVFEGDPTRLREPDVVRAGSRLEAFMSKQALAPTTRSFADLLMSIDRTLATSPVQEPVWKWSDEKIAQLTLLFDFGDPDTVREAREDFYSKDGKFYRIQGLLKDSNTTELGEFRDAVSKEIEAIKLHDVKIHLTGSAMISTNALEHIIFSTIASLGVAVVAIFLLVLFLLRSFTFALIALFPNLVPIIVTLAAMQIVGVSLRVATVMIFSMALGIAVDACVYLITRFREESLRHHSTDGESHSDVLHAIIERTMRGSGRPVVYTTAMLLAGFSALAISKFGALRDFAILSAVTLSTAMVVDLLLWPALVMLVKPKLGFVKPKN